jgi:hypothetical protein
LQHTQPVQYQRMLVCRKKANTCFLKSHIFMFMHEDASLVKRKSSSIFFKVENGGSMFLRNVRIYQEAHTLWQPKTSTITDTAVRYSNLNIAFILFHTFINLTIAYLWQCNFQCIAAKITCIILCSPPRHVEAQDMEGGIWHTAISRTHIRNTELVMKSHTAVRDYSKMH